MADIRLEGGTVDLVRRTYQGPGRSGELTETEARLLAYLVERPSRDVSRDELLVEVWGMPVTSLSRCVDTAMRRLRVKLERVPRRPRHFVTRHGTGYRFEPLRQAAAAMRSASVSPTLLGRVQELAEVVETLRGGVRWITLHGPAGIG
ncbi:MAG: winged helix-turn-helix domain-containing protein, partial [Myxococcota bacterium]